MYSRMGKPQATGLSCLPWEVFDEITGYLCHNDILALSFACKVTHRLARRALYATVKVRDKTAFASLARALVLEPHLCDAARTYKVVWRAPWWSLDLLDSFRCLQEFVFRPTNFLRGHPAQMVRRIAAGDWIQPTLRQCARPSFLSAKLVWHRVLTL